MVNLLANALKFTFQGKVTINASISNEKVPERMNSLESYNTRNVCSMKNANSSILGIQNIVNDEEKEELRRSVDSFSHQVKRLQKSKSKHRAGT